MFQLVATEELGVEWLLTASDRVQKSSWVVLSFFLVLGVASGVAQDEETETFLNMDSTTNICTKCREVRRQVWLLLTETAKVKQ
jgi:nitrate/TMAO reductase-like tetraheme cytochrome c subunit